MTNTVGVQARTRVCAGLVQRSDGIVTLCAEVSLHNRVGIGGGGGGGGADCVHVRYQRGVQGVNLNERAFAASCL